MKHTAWLLLPLLGCATADGPAINDAASDTDAPAAEAECHARIVRLEPGDNVAGVNTGAEVSLVLDLPLPPGAAWRLEVVGAAGEVTWSNDRRTAWWRPTEPLLHGTRYTVEATVCDDARTATFTTAAAQVDPVALAGSTWAVTLDTLEWLAPLSSDLLTDLFEVTAVQLQVVGPPEALRLSATAVSDRCLPTVDLGSLDLAANPSFSSGPARVEIDVGRARVIAEDIVLSGTFTADGQAVSDLGVSALLDLAALTPLIGGLDACIMSRALGEPCVPCSDGREACVPVVLAAELTQQSEVYEDDCGERR
jgi:hypothetical protein